MKRLYEVQDMSTGYLEVIEGVLSDGRKRAPRGQKTREVNNATIVLRDPTRSHPVGIGRRYGEAIVAAEATGLVSGLADPQLMMSVGSNFQRFLDGGNLHGTYGPRVRGQLRECVARLRADPDTRQALMTIWDPLHDGANFTPKDLPCTIVLAFAIYDGKLEMSTTMRSNDVWWGTAHDIPMFTALQLTVADALRLPPGPYVHNAFSLHVYERDLDDIAELSDAPTGFEPRGGGFCGALGIDDAQERAQKIFTGRTSEIHGDLTESELYYDRLLAPHIERVKKSRAMLTGQDDFEELG
jgi:thymidylate synthase